LILEKRRVYPPFLDKSTAIEEGEQRRQGAPSKMRAL
jgi:hypothetical protein